MPITRRDFVRLGSGAVAASALMKTTLLEAAAPIETGAPVRFASIGMGVRGCDLLKAALRVPGASCVGISDLYEGRIRLGREVVKQDVAFTNDYRALLNRKDIDAVIVAVPDHLHRRIVTEACAAGKDVYCEKPMSHTVEDGEAMVKAVRESKRIFACGSQRVSSVVYAKAREIYHSGRLGDVTMIEGFTDRNSPSGAWVYPIPQDANENTIRWDGFIQDAPKRPFEPVRFFRWRCFRDYGEGLPGDLFVHLISGIQFVTGAVLPPKSAQSLGGIYQLTDGREYPDLMQTLYDYGKFQVYIRCNQNNDAGEATIFRGTKGTMTISGNAVSFKPQDTTPHPEGYATQGWPSDQRAIYFAQWAAEHPQAAPLSQHAESDTETFKAPAGYDDTLDHVANFFDSVRTRKRPVEDELFGHSAAIACHMANDSYFLKQISFMPVKWEG